MGLEAQHQVFAAVVVLWLRDGASDEQSGLQRREEGECLLDPIEYLLECPLMILDPLHGIEFCEEVVHVD